MRRWRWLIDEDESSRCAWLPLSVPQNRSVRMPSRGCSSRELECARYRRRPSFPIALAHHDGDHEQRSRVASVCREPVEIERAGCIAQRMGCIRTAKQKL